MSSTDRPVGFADDPIFDLHVTGQHPENSGRLQAIRRAIEHSQVGTHLRRLEVSRASEEDIEAAHAYQYVERLEAISAGGGAWIDADTVITPQSYEVALHAAGAAERVVQAVLTEETGSALGIVRPPGHHATVDRAMGFCLFNNAAVAARMARSRFDIERTLLVDFDVHHGNGTQDIFYRDPSVFYFSIHQWPLFPGTGRIEEIGSGAGAGYNANVPIPARCGDDDYRRIFDQVLFPLARRYEPQLILVSAGFDAYWADPLAQEWVTIDGFAKMVAALRWLSDEYCPGRLALVLEGGYNPAGLGAAVVAALGELTGVPEVVEPIRPPDLSGRPEILSLIDVVKRTHGLD